MKNFPRSIPGLAAILLIFASAVLFEGCRASQFKTQKARTIKKGKPIPCPLKDC
tara:strand:- start:494 stop:655 length:162 start_codon:yes stop_codon:yes gene_type:complete